MYILQHAEETSTPDICSGPGLVCLKKIQASLDVAALNLTVAESILRRSDLELSQPARVREACKCDRPCQGDILYIVESAVFEQDTCDNRQVFKSSYLENIEEIP